MSTGISDMKKVPQEWAYLYCSHCKKLSPILDKNTHVECMVCKYVIITAMSQRKVILNKVEAKLRHLSTVKYKDHEKDKEGE